MKHSVVIPLYNKRDYIGETIASLAAQEMLPSEIFIVDDASTDDSARQAELALSRYAAAFAASTRAEVVRMTKNGGPSVARNAGLDRATGDVISFLDADDRYRPDGLKNIAGRMRDHSLEMVVLGYDSDPPGEYFPDLSALAGEWIQVAEDVFLLPDPLRTAGHPEFIMGRASNVAVRRRWLDRHRYHVGSCLNEGIDFWYRVLKEIAASEGARVALISAPLIRFRILDDSLSHRHYADWRLLEVPPTVIRYSDSADVNDRRLVELLGRRWLQHAMRTLPDQHQKQSFLDHHRLLLSRIGLSVPQHESQ